MNAATTHRNGISQVSILPTFVLPSDALHPPHPVCPHKMICLTCSALTAYSITAVADRSVAVMTLAMLRCTKQVPGLAPRMVVSGWRESEQPSQRMGGACQVGNLDSRSPSDSANDCAHFLLPSRNGAIALWEAVGLRG